MSSKVEQVVKLMTKALKEQKEGFYADTVNKVYAEFVGHANYREMYDRMKSECLCIEPVSIGRYLQVALDDPAKVTIFFVRRNGDQLERIPYIELNTNINIENLESSDLLLCLVISMTNVAFDLAINEENRRAKINNEVSGQDKVVDFAKKLEVFNIAFEELKKRYAESKISIKVSVTTPSGTCLELNMEDLEK